MHLSFRKIKFLVFVSVFYILSFSFASAAASFDASSSGNTGTATLTIAHTNAGNFLKACYEVYSAIATITGVTYNGNAMTQLGTRTNGLYTLYEYYAYAPSTGTHDIVATLSTTPSFGIFYGVASSYSGVSQSGYPDAQNSGNTSGNGNVVGTLTTSADNAWTSLCVASDDDNSNTGGAGTTVRASNSNGRLSISDGNGPVTPAGSTALTIVPSVSTGGTAFMIDSFAPAAATAGQSGGSFLQWLLSLMASILMFLIFIRSGPRFEAWIASHAPRRVLFPRHIKRYPRTRGKTQP